MSWHSWLFFPRMTRDPTKVMGICLDQTSGMLLSLQSSVAIQTWRFLTPSKRSHTFCFYHCQLLTHPLWNHEYSYRWLHSFKENLWPTFFGIFPYVFHRIPDKAVGYGEGGNLTRKLWQIPPSLDSHCAAHFGCPITSTHQTLRWPLTPIFSRSWGGVAQAWKCGSVNSVPRLLNGSQWQDKEKSERQIYTFVSISFLAGQYLNRRNVPRDVMNIQTNGAIFSRDLSMLMELESLAGNQIEKGKF